MWLSAATVPLRLRWSVQDKPPKPSQHRYIRLADPKVAELIEHLAEHADQQRPHTGLRASLRARRLAAARTPTQRTNGRPLLRECLDWTERREHLGGAIPAAILDRALQQAWLARGDDRSIRVRPAARAPLATLGVDLDQLSEATSSRA